MSKINPFKVLHDQVKRSLLGESKLAESERKLFQWQYLITFGSITYLVGKGGANTCFYQIARGDIGYCYPEELLEKIKEWGRSKYAAFTIESDDGGIAGPFTSLEEAKSFNLPSSKVNLYIIGHDKSATESQKLYIYKPVITGKAKWNKYSAELDVKPTKTSSKGSKSKETSKAKKTVKKRSSKKTVSRRRKSKGE